MGTCLWCGDDEISELLEFWGDHNFLLDTCCESRRLELSQALVEDKAFARRFFSDQGFNGLRRAADTGTSIIADFDLKISPIAQLEAKNFVRRHHQHCARPPAGWKFGAGIWNRSILIGVVFVGRPVARRLDTGTRLEVTRLCLDRGLPDALRWNASSQLYGWAAREARKLGFDRISTYITEAESGVSLKAAGWVLEANSRGGSWERSTRSRNSENTGPKSRWGRSLSEPRAFRIAATSAQSRLRAEQ